MSKSKPAKKPPAELPVAVEIEKVKRTIPQSFWLLKSNTCKKLGMKAVGGISYQILADSDRQTLHVTITANFGGGYFSREVVPFSAIKACLDRRERDKPFPSKLFREAFVGRSSNNAGFMAAILRAEGLLALAPDTESQHMVADDWTAWQKTMLAETGEKIDIEMPIPEKSAPENASDSDAPPPPDAKKTPTSKRAKADTKEIPPEKTGE